MRSRQTGYVSFILWVLGMTSVAAQPSMPAHIAHRDFWFPTLHMARLSYCLFDGKTCGMPVANQYCNVLGYQSASSATIEHDIGLTHYLDSSLSCKGHQCQGFKVIRCTDRLHANRLPAYYYRLRRFVYPRMAGYRVDWCLEQHRHCGQKAAHSFCRMQGYESVKQYQKQTAVPLTRTIGSRERCDGPSCVGFKSISCYR